LFALIVSFRRDDAIFDGCPEPHGSALRLGGLFVVAQSRQETRAKKRIHGRN